MKLCVVLACAAISLSACSKQDATGNLPDFPPLPHSEAQREAMSRAASENLASMVKPYYLGLTEPPFTHIRFMGERAAEDDCPGFFYAPFDERRPTPDEAAKELGGDARALERARGWITTKVTDPTARAYYLPALESLERRNREDVAMLERWRVCSLRSEQEQRVKDELLESAKQSLPRPPS